MSPVRTPALAVANDDRVGLFDLQRQRARLEADIKARIDAVLAHGQFILGPEVETLEKRLATYAGAKHVVRCRAVATR
jgi:UDP-2-acetamido-2-deoxy-ribo-hexuluronate aminotransferase